MDRDALLKDITVLDFMAVDLHLFLNTHPHDQDALCAYNDIVANSQKARQQYEAHFGPLSMGCPADTKEWTWENCPWPWQAAYNFRVDGHDSYYDHRDEYAKGYSVFEEEL